LEFKRSSFLGQAGQAQPAAPRPDASISEAQRRFAEYSGYKLPPCTSAQGQQTSTHVTLRRLNTDADMVPPAR
jgi:hypothetical protein